MSWWGGASVFVVYQPIGVVLALDIVFEISLNALLIIADLQSKAHRWMTNGAREVLRATSRGKIKALFLAPDIEAPMDDLLSSIVEKANVQKVFGVYALSRKKLGKVYQSRKKMAVVGVLDLNGVDPLFKDLVGVAEKFSQIMIQETQPIPSINVDS